MLGSITRSGCVILTLETEAAALDVVATAVGVAGEGALARSRVIVLAGLSVRMPPNTAWRMRLSGVHSPKATSTTSEGRTHRSEPTLRLDHRPDLNSAASRGGRCTSSFTKRACSSAAAEEPHPVPTAPAAKSFPSS
ncbi:hypothetical protein D3C71_1472270 [compost metagenome]